MARILIVDDEQLTLDMLGAFLRLIGHESVGVLNRRQTLDRLAYDVPDAILLDIMLPDGNGIDICRELRERTETATLPIVMISAYSPPLVKEAQAAGATGYLMKPIKLDELKTILQSNGLH